MEFYELHPDNPQERYIKKAIEVLRKGGVIIYPTDTVYALGCDIFNHNAVKKVYEIKNESETKLFSFIAPDLKNIAKYAKVSDSAYKTIKHLAPGPYTFVLPASKEIPKKLWTKRKTVGIRIPDNRITEMLTRGLGNPIISTSATTRLGQVLSNPDEIRAIFDYSVDLMLSFGEQNNQPSSIIDFSVDPPEILREGSGDLSIFY
jgi:tRNA threonylcarbamoyl adenosine modification protein (Sua5/YciO/YrdC/YwlC family)